MSKCKFCGADITWIKNKKGQWVPINTEDFEADCDPEDRTMHFESCRRKPEEKPLSYEATRRPGYI
jgi:hypothetical protein